MDSYYKYIKYKNKYLYLKQSLYGGGKITTKAYFDANIGKLYENISKDTFLINNFKDLPEKYTDDKDLLENIFNFIVQQTNDDKIIDFVCTLYLNNGLGVPNSIENIGRLKDNITKFNILSNAKENDGKTLNFKTFNTLSSLEEYIESKKIVLNNLEEKKLQKKKDKEKYIKIKEAGEDDVIVELETDNYTIYIPTTEAGSKYYGRNTRWCTAADNDNKFNYYNKQGKLYIIQSKKDPLDKYQIHFENTSFNNAKDADVSESELNNLIKDDILKKWYVEKIMIYISTYGNLLKFLPEELQTDEIILITFKNNGYVLQYASDRVKNNYKFVRMAINNDPQAFKFASERLRDDHDIAMAAIKKNALVIQYASDEIKDIYYIVLFAVKINGLVLQFASDRLKKTYHIVLTAVKQNGIALKYSTNEFKDDYDIVLTAIEQNGIALQYASDRFKNDDNIVLTAIKQNGIALQYASDRFKNDDNIVLTAVKQNGIALQYASDRFKNDDNIVLTAVKQNGYALQYAFGRLKNNEQIVLEAVKQNGDALRFALYGLQNNYDIVLAAVTQNGYALKYASDKLKDNDNIVLTVITQNKDALKYASDRLILKFM